MLYHYVAADAGGNMLEGEFEGNTLQDALSFLAGKSLRPVSVKPLKQMRAGIAIFGGGITTTDKVFLTKYLALMLKVGTDLLSAINILIADFEKPAVRNFLLEVRDNLGRGQPFYEAFAKHPKEFSPTFINLVKAAEASGNLEKTFEDLSNTLEKEAELRGRVTSALIYPLVLVCASIAIMIFLTTFALPKVANVFENSGVAPPAFSEIVLTIGLFIGNNIWTLMISLIVLVGACTWAVRETNPGKRVFQNILNHTPLVKGIYRDLAVQRMASTMSSLMKAGLPITQTITVAAETVGLREYKDALIRVANDGLAKGLTIGEAFKREPVFPKMISNLVAISEKAGHIEEVLTTLADFYGSNVDANIKTAVSLLEPFMLLVMGVIVATIALSVIVPIYQLTTQF